MTYIVVGFVGMFILGIFCGIIFNSLCEDRWYIYRTEDRIQIRPYTKNLYLKIVRGEVELIACSSFLITAFIKYSMLKKELNGEFYPCKPDIFEKKYELVEE